MFSVPKLQYEYDALEDVISAEIMELHHDKHHQAYVDKLNVALESHPELQGKSVEAILQILDSLPAEIKTIVRNNGGGHYNHSLFWVWMSPNGGGKPGGELEAAITQRYGSYEAFVEEFNAKAISLFGSGWVFLQPNLDIVALPNQDSPVMNGGEEPILGLDVWEHAYYLDYKNHRDEYVKKWWGVVNWDVVRERYDRLRVSS